MCCLFERGVFYYLLECLRLTLLFLWFSLSFGGECNNDGSQENW